jgi:NAD(P)H-flavin reductase
VILTMTDDPGWEGETRQLDADVLAELVGGLEGKTFLVAGPPAMAEGVSESLRGAGLPEDGVLVDGFTGY